LIEGAINAHVNLSKRFYPIIILLAFVVAGAALNEARETEVVTDYHSMYFPDDPGMRETRIFEDEFVGTRWVDILIKIDREYIDDVLEDEVLTMTEELVDIVSASPGVFSVSSVLDIGSTREEILAAPTEARLKYVDKKMEYSLIRITINDREAPDNVKLLEAMQGTVERIDVVKGSTVTVGGFVGIEHSFDKAFKEGLRASIIASALMVTLVLLLVFRSPTTSVAIMVPVITAVSIAFGLMHYIKIPINMLTVLFGAVTIGLAVDYGLHIVHRYHEEEKKGNKQAMNTAFTRMGRNTFFTAITTMAVFSSLLFSKLRLVNEYGIMSFIAIGFSFLTILFFLPSFLMLEKKIGRVKIDLSWLSSSVGAEHFLLKIVTGLAGYSLKRPLTVVVLVLIAMVPMFYGMSTLKTSHDVYIWLPDDDPVSQAYRTVEKKFGKTEHTFILVRADDVRDRHVVESISAITKELEELPYAKKVTSISNFVDLSDYDKGQITNLPVELQSQLVTSTYTEAIIILEADVGLGMSMKYTNEIQEIIDNAPSTVDAEIQQVGMMYMHTLTEDLMKETKVMTTLISLVLVAILLYIALGGVNGIFLGMLPLVTAIIFAMGTMGLLGMEYSVITILLATILLGLGIDYSIHFLARYREELEIGKGPIESILISVNTVGESIAITSITTMFGFLSLLTMTMPPVQEFGAITALGIIFSAIFISLLIPAGIRIQEMVKKTEDVSFSQAFRQFQSR
jgi:predicted RND superfamily exporter protein